MFISQSKINRRAGLNQWWAIKRPSGVIILSTLANTRKNAIDTIMIFHASRTWKILHEMGYKVVKVEVVELKADKGWPVLRKGVNLMSAPLDTSGHPLQHANARYSNPLPVILSNDLPDKLPVLHKTSWWSRFINKYRR